MNCLNLNNVLGLLRLQGRSSQCIKLSPRMSVLCIQILKTMEALFEVLLVQYGTTLDQLQG